jgi:ORF6N domain
MNEQLIQDETIIHQIYILRGQKVMLDKDLARLYEVETRYLNKAVSRNIKRFPADFMFQLSHQEFRNLMFQFGTSNWGGTRKLPYAFTEQGVAALSSILNSDRAIALNIQIIRIFVRFRQLYADHTEIRLEIEKIKKDLQNQGKNMEVVFQYLDELSKKVTETEKAPIPRKQIGYKPEGF